jgi:hypothetical protein
MSYWRRQSRFSVPWSHQLPAFCYLLLALLSVLFVIAGEQSDPSSWLFYLVVAQDAGRVVSARGFAALLVVGSIAAALQGALRGVRIRRDGIELRDLRYSVLPRALHLRWAQLSLVSLGQSPVLVELWDGRTVTLPLVADPGALGRALEVAAAAHGVAVQGGPGLDDLPELEPAVR